MFFLLKTNIFQHSVPEILNYQQYVFFFYPLEGSARTCSLQTRTRKLHFTASSSHIANDFYHFFPSRIINDQQPKQNWKHIHQSRMHNSREKKYHLNNEADADIWERWEFWLSNARLMLLL